MLLDHSNNGDYDVLLFDYCHAITAVHLEEQRVSFGACNATQ